MKYTLKDRVNDETSFIMKGAKDIMWAEESVFYQIYPLGFCGAPQKNDGVLVPRIRKVMDWIPHIKSLCADAVYFSPVFASDTHGYDTRDFRRIDCRLGENADFRDVCDALHQNGIRVVLDGVFHHVGRGFWAFLDVLEKKWDSPYKDWFYINFDGDSPYRDGFWYEGWEGHYELVKLNLNNEAVAEYIFSCIKGWIEEFSIDGLRLDVAYSLDFDFLRRLRQFCDSQKEDFYCIGELLHGDYNRWVNPQMLNSCTNYECYKGLSSSFNSMNLFEITHSLLRQFGSEPWTLYRGKHLLCFVDNHDVTRIASLLQNPAHLPLIYTLLFTMPGIPCIYYGSEWGAHGEKQPGSDEALRPCFDAPKSSALTAHLAALAKIHHESPAILYGDFSQLHLTNRQLVWQRRCESETVWIAVNADEAPYTAYFSAPHGMLENMITKEAVAFDGALALAPYSAAVYRVLG